MTRRAIPDHERLAVAAEIEQLLNQTDGFGQRKWTTVKLGDWCGVTHEAIRKARTHSGVGPTIRDAILRLTGLSAEELMRKHGIAPGQSASGGDYSSGLSPVSGMSPALGTPTLGTPVLGAANLIAFAQNAVQALQADGYSSEDARLSVMDALLVGDCAGELALYRKARATLEARKRDESGTGRKGLSQSKEAKTLRKR